MKSVRPFRQVAGWVMVGALIYAPLALGSIPPPALKGLEALLALATLAWLLDAVFARSVPRIPLPVMIGGAWLLLQGWFMVWNAHSGYDFATGHTRTLLSPLPSAPGAVERASAQEAMVRLTALVACLWVAVDLAREPLWRMRLLWTVAWTGVSFAVFGLMQQMGWVHFIAAQMNPYEGVYFGTYNYHANAGAYLNLVIPAICALLFVALSERRGRRQIVLLGTLLACCLVAALVNTSRGAQAVTILLLVGLGGWVGVRLARGGGERARTARLALGMACVICLVLGGLILPHLQSVMQKWEQLPQVLTGDSGRMQVWPIAAAMAREGGPFGQGPGAFKMLLPRSPLLTNAFYSRWIVQGYVPGRPISMWSQAHEDYLQTLVEFGWVGGMAAGTLLFGGIFCALHSVLRHRIRRTTYVSLGTLAALLAVALHAAFDFPLQVASLQLYVAVYLGIAWAVAAPDLTATSEPSALTP